MRTGLPAALLRGTPSAIRDDRFTRCPFPAATTHAPVALARSSNTAMEHRNRCTDLRHPELLATSLLKCPRQDCCETPSETKKIGKLSPLSSFIFLTLRVVHDQAELTLISQRNIDLVSFNSVLRSLCEHKQRELFGGAGTDIAEIIRYFAKHPEN